MPKIFTKKLLLTLATLFGMILLFLVIATTILYFIMQRPFRDAESKLTTEAASLRLSEFELQSENFRHGQCLDNCPLYTQIYRVDTTREEARKVIREELMAEGYEISFDHAGNFHAQKDDYHLTTRLLPELEFGTADYEENIDQKNQKVNQVMVNINFIPSK